MSRKQASTRIHQSAGVFTWTLPSRLAGLPFIILFVLSIAVGSPAWAANNGKGGVAPDLREEMHNGSPSEMVRLVVTLDGADATQVMARITELGGRIHGHFRRVGVLSLDLPLEAVDDLAAVEGIRYVAPDREVTGLASQLDITTGAASVFPGMLPPDDEDDDGQGGYDGTGVGVAVLDSGIARGHLDLVRSGKKYSVVLAVDFTGTGKVGDLFGHGTHVAGLIAGDGDQSFTMGRDYTGVARGINLVNLTVLDDSGRGNLSNVIAAIDYAIGVRESYNIRVINLSLAAPPIDSYVDDPICQAVARATSAGIVVVAAAGNFGQDKSTGEKTYGGITSPGISPAVITVGAVDTRGTAVRSDDAIAPFSSRGPTLSHASDPLTGAVTYDLLAKPDLVAPGARLVSLERDYNNLVKTYPALHVAGTKTNGKYMMLSGTSMSAAVVSGTVALMLQANPSLTPNMVKAILMYTAQIMNGPDLFEQGAGLLNADGAVRLARSLRQDANVLPAGSTLAARPMPEPLSTIAGETVAWAQGLIWGVGALRGQAMFTTQQEAYSQSLIWGIGRLDAWGAGVTYYDGLYSSSYVSFGGDGQWNYVTWDSGTPTASGLIWSRQLYASGLIWGNRVISSDFFDVSPSSLIWGISRYGGNYSGLVWGINDAGLIWGVSR